MIRNLVAPSQICHPFPPLIGEMWHIPIKLERSSIRTSRVILLSGKIPNEYPKKYPKILCRYMFCIQKLCSHHSYSNLKNIHGPVLLLVLSSGSSADRQPHVPTYWVWQETHVWHSSFQAPTTTRAGFICGMWFVKVLTAYQTSVLAGLLPVCSFRPERFLVYYTLNLMKCSGVLWTIYIYLYWYTVDTCQAEVMWLRFHLYELKRKNYFGSERLCQEPRDLYLHSALAINFSSDCTNFTWLLCITTAYQQ